MLEPGGARGANLGRDLLEKSCDGWHAGRSGFAPADHSPSAVVEDAIEGGDPRPHRSVLQRVRSRGIGGGHTADRTERTARWVDGKAEPPDAGRGISLRAEHPGPDEKVAAVAGWRHFAQPAHVGDHSG